MTEEAPKTRCPTCDGWACSCAKEDAPTQPQPRTRTRWLAWAALNAEGTPVAASVRNNPADVPVIVDNEGPIQIAIEIVGEPVQEIFHAWVVKSEDPGA